LVISASLRSPPGSARTAGVGVAVGATRVGVGALVGAVVACAVFVAAAGDTPGAEVGSVGA